MFRITGTYLKYLKKEILFSGHIMALGAALTGYMGSLLFSIKTTALPFICIYLFVQVIYWFDRIVGIKGDAKGNSARSNHVYSLMKYAPILMSIYTIFFTVILLEKQKYIVLLLTYLLLALGLLYGKYFKHITRWVFGFKNFFVSTFFVIFFLYFLIYEEKVIFTLGSVIFMIYIFIRSLYIQIFYDLKDIEDDKEKKLKTFPVVLGRSFTFRTLSIINSLSMLIIAVGVWLKEFPRYILILVIPISIAQYIIYKSQKKLQYYFFIFMGLEYTISAILLFGLSKL
jgi:4-hydroxybenzoate polyprenyltransferase